MSLKQIRSVAASVVDCSKQLVQRTKMLVSQILIASIRHSYDNCEIDHTIS